MNNELNELLTEIEQIIAKIAAFDSQELKLSYQERHQLTQLFHNKLHQAKQVKLKKQVRLAS